MPFPGRVTLPAAANCAILRRNVPAKGHPDVTDRDRITAYLPRLFGYALSLTGDRHQAEDLVQDCAMKALGARNVPMDEPAYRSWLFRILRNAFIDTVRQRASRLAREEPEIFPDGGEFWQGNQRFITALTVKLEMAKLPRPQREIVALIDIVGLSYGEAAAFLEIPVGTVMSRISRARRVLLEAVGSSNVHELPVGKNKKKETG